MVPFMLFTLDSSLQMHNFLTFSRLTSNTHTFPESSLSISRGRKRTALGRKGWQSSFLSLLLEEFFLLTTLDHWRQSRSQERATRAGSAPGSESFSPLSSSDRAGRGPDDAPFTGLSYMRLWSQHPAFNPSRPNGPPRGSSQVRLDIQFSSVFLPLSYLAAASLQSSREKGGGGD